MTEKIQLQSIIQDANDNFDNGRIKDAYQHYSIVAQQFMENAEIEHVLYYSYRALICLYMLNRDEDHIKEILKLGTNLVKYSLNKTKDLIGQTSNPLSRVKLYQLQQQAIINLNFTEHLDKVNNEIFDGLDQLSEEFDLSPPERINYLEKIIDFANSHQLNRDLSNHTDQLIELLLQEARNTETDRINIYTKLQYLQHALHLMDKNDNRYSETESEIKKLERIRDNN